MSVYLQTIKETEALRDSHGTAWAGINAESAVRTKLQNRFKTGIDIAQFTAEKLALRHSRRRCASPADL